jgi:hypothetical protein
MVIILESETKTEVTRGCRKERMENEFYFSFLFFLILLIYLGMTVFVYLFWAVLVLELRAFH